jgi:hypothetical protein
MATARQPDDPGSTVPKARCLDQERISDAVDVRCIFHPRRQRHRQFVTNVSSEDGCGEPESKFRKIVRDGRHFAEKKPMRLIHVGLSQSICQACQPRHPRTES